MAINQLAWARQFAPSGAFPLEANVIFDSYELALNYAKNENLAVLGKVISITTDDIDPETKEVKHTKGVYYVSTTGEEATLTKVGLNQDELDLSNYVTKGELSGVYKYIGSCKYSELPQTSSNGNVYNITEEFTLNDTKYPAGTNVVYDGERWEVLSGIFDTSSFATTGAVGALQQELSAVSAVANAAKQSATEAGALATTVNNELANKANQADFETLSGTVSELGIGFGQLNTTVNGLNTVYAPISLTQTVGTNTQAIGELNTWKGTTTTQLSTIETNVGANATNIGLNTAAIGQLGESLSALSGNVETAVALSGQVATLGGQVSNALSDISAIKTNHKVKNLAESETFLVLSDEGVLASKPLALVTGTDENSNHILKLQTNVPGQTTPTVLASLNVNDFVKDGMVSSVAIADGNLVITWNTAAGSSTTEIPLTDFAPVYTFGSGLNNASGTITVKVSSANNNSLKVNNNGELYVDVSDIQAAIQSFDWIDVDAETGTEATA